MTEDRRRATALILGTLAAAAITLPLIAPGPNEDALRLALRVTGRTSFFVWLLAFVASPLGSKLLRRWRPRIGLFYAGGQLVHLVLIVSMLTVVPGYVPPALVVVFGGGGLVVIAAMAVTSFSVPARAVGRTWWRRVHTTGMWWIAAIYAYDFFRLDAAYLPFAALLAVALLLRVPRPRLRAIDPVR